jgi:flagellar assembly protein FliH
LSTDTRTVHYPRLDGPSSATERERGYTQGHVAGYAAGLRLAAQEARAAHDAFEAEKADFRTRSSIQLAEQSALLLAIGDRAAQAALPVLEQADRAVAAAALQLAEAILGTELSSAQTAARAALGRAFPSREQAPPLHIRLHPADAVLLSGTAPAAGITLVEDPTLQRGDAMAAYPDGMIDARISTALDRAREALEGSGA